MRSSIFLALVACLYILSLNACKSSYTPSTFPKSQLIFGYGGGFAGTVNTYFLLPDGSLFYLAPGQDEAELIQKMKKSEAKTFFKEAEELDLQGRNLNAPGNMYAFVGIKEGEKVHKLIWDKDLGKAPMDLKDFYQRLMKTPTPEM